MAGQLTQYEKIVERGDTLTDIAIERLRWRRNVREKDIERIDACLGKHAENKKGADRGGDSVGEAQTVV